MTEFKREIRKVFLGRTIRLEDGRLSPIGPDDLAIPSGVADGALGIRILGVGHKNQLLETSLNEEMTIEAVREAMKDIGRGVLFRQQPEIVACLIRYVLTKPAMLTFTFREGEPVLTAWAGRGFSGPIARGRALKALKKKLPETVTFSEKTAPEEEKEEKPQKEKKKRLSASEKKALREEQRKEALKARKEREELAAQRIAEMEAFETEFRKSTGKKEPEREDKE
ncbi:MAG: hypothetical protein J5589_01165 [Firmicutes bacterium]|nr:hypothetical protein [Bacillota bacterium]